MRQNATPLRKSAPWPPNISDEHVSCPAPATRNASFQILFKCPTPTNAFETATKPSRFAHFWQGAESHAPATQNHIWTFKSGPSMFFLNILTWKHASHHNGVHFFNISKSGPNMVFCNLYILTSKRALRHNGVQLVDTHSPAGSAPAPPL